MKGFKWFWGSPIWRWPHERFLSEYFRLVNLWEKDYHDDKTADPYIKKAVELYGLLFGLLLVILYLVTFYAAREECSWHIIIRIMVTCTAALISLYRVFEMVATAIQLHFFKPYKTSYKSRALILTLFAYIQTAVAFATTFLAEAFLMNDCYQESIRKNLIDGFYFSVVTIATLGYGEFRPQKWLGKLLVVGEILVGIFLIVVLVQRIVAIQHEDDV